MTRAERRTQAEWLAGADLDDGRFEKDDEECPCCPGGHQMTDMDMPPLLPCPMCGSKDGYTLGTGPTYRWWNMNCNGCGRIVDECASDRRHDFDSKLPDRWPAADEAWNEAGAYAAAEVAKERERCAKVCEAYGTSCTTIALAAAIRAGSAKS